MLLDAAPASLCSSLLWGLVGAVAARPRGTAAAAGLAGTVLLVRPAGRAARRRAAPAGQRGINIDQTIKHVQGGRARLARAGGWDCKGGGFGCERNMLGKGAG
jgi:hypothetical protein